LYAGFSNEETGFHVLQASFCQVALYHTKFMIHEFGQGATWSRALYDRNLIYSLDVV
jgi:hypothetical protein